MTRRPIQQRRIQHPQFKPLESFRPPTPDPRPPDKHPIEFRVVLHGLGNEFRLEDFQKGDVVELGRGRVGQLVRGDGAAEGVEDALAGDVEEHLKG